MLFWNNPHTALTRPAEFPPSPLANPKSLWNQHICNLPFASSLHTRNEGLTEFRPVSQIPQNQHLPKPLTTVHSARVTTPSNATLTRSNSPNPLCNEHLQKTGGWGSPPLPFLSTSPQVPLPLLPILFAFFLIPVNCLLSTQSQMIPFLHLGPLTIATFGLMVAAALLVAAYVLQADFRRRDLRADAFLIIGIAGLAGIVGARLYHVLESPAEFFADPWPQLFSRYGFAWFGGFLGGFATLLILARREKIPMLVFLDACSPAAAVGYAIGRIGCLLSGDGDYGMPTSWHWPWGMAFPNGVVPTTQTCVEHGWPADCRVYPTPIYEFIAWMLIAYLLWRWAARGTTEKTSVQTYGQIFCGYLILTGIARFLVEFIRLNPRSFFGMTNAQSASLGSILLGIFLLWYLKNHQPAPETSAPHSSARESSAQKRKPAASRK